MSGHVARFIITSELLMQALALPEGTRINDIYQHQEYLDTFVFYVEHPDLPGIPIGDEATEIKPIITADYTKKPSMWLTFDWNIDK